MDIFSLTGNPLESIKTFVIKTNDINIIIDTRINNTENRNNIDKLIEKSLESIQFLVQEI
ncbi:MAG: hypothetical protein Q4B36_03010 [Tissierellia bacterium]|nr:hypothetical protein [Tissierellia bacterium]